MILVFLCPSPSRSVSLSHLSYPRRPIPFPFSGLFFRCSSALIFSLFFRRCVASIFQISNTALRFKRDVQPIN